MKRNKSFLGCNDAQLRAQYRSNAEGLQRMLNKARETGKKVNGYTRDQLTEMVEKYNKLANL